MPVDIVIPNSEGSGAGAGQEIIGVNGNPGVSPPRMVEASPVRVYPAGHFNPV